MFIIPYKRKSSSARNLCFSLRIPMVTKRLQIREDLCINWGYSAPVIGKFKILNDPQYVNNAINKLKTFRILKDAGVSIPDFTTSYTQACEWINDGHSVMARSLLESHSGKGCIHCETIEELPKDSKVYVKYFPKKYEFRVHVFGDKVIDYVQKRKRAGINEAEYDKYIRSYNNGWVFCRENAIVKESVKTLAVDAVKALGLDFGAVDIVMLGNGKSKVLEINCAPALEGTTLERYTQAIKELGDV